MFFQECFFYAFSVRAKIYHPFKLKPDSIWSFLKLFFIVIPEMHMVVV